jgi:nitrous oxide reductase accessory protein NosL
MKYLLFVILFLWALAASSQSDATTKPIPTYIRTGQGGETLYCGYTVMEFYSSKKRVIVRTPQISLDLTIVVRSKEYWVGVTENKQEYIMQTIGFGNQYGISFLPKNDSLIGFYIHPSKELCE